MSTKRKVDNLLALAVLSTVYQRPMHRYEMTSIMRARGKAQDMDIKVGSTYTVVQNLEKHGFVEAIGSTRDGARPERVVYRITEAGKREMVEWTRELIAEPETEHPKFAAGLSIMVALPPAEVIAALAHRLERLSASIEARRTALRETEQAVPRLFLVEEEYRLAIIEAEASWVASLLGELRSGSFPNIAGWRTWHDTGTAPADIAELAERGATPD